MLLHLIFFSGIVRCDVCSCCLGSWFYEAGISHWEENAYQIWILYVIFWCYICFSHPSNYVTYSMFPHYLMFNFVDQIYEFS